MNPITAAGTEAYDGRAIQAARTAARQINAMDAEKLRQACRDFEQIFVKMMLDSMKKTLDGDALIPQNAGEKLFEDMLYDEYAGKIADTANLGIATMMYDQLSAGLPGDTIDRSF